MCGIFTLFKTHSSLDLTKIREFVRSFVEKNENNILPNSDLSNKPIEKVNLKIGLKGLLDVIMKRGPDYSIIVEYTYQYAIGLNSDLKINYVNTLDILKKDIDLMEYCLNFNNQRFFIFLSSVLNLRGVIQITKQPIISQSTNNLLQYNGEIYSIRKDRKINYLQFLELNKIDLLFENDGAQLSSLFNEISKRFYSDFSLKVDETINHENSYQINELYADYFFELMNSIESDHAFVFHDNLNKKIIFGRDLFGKRSLLMCYIKSSDLMILTSTLSDDLYKMKETIEIIEVPANCLIVYDISSNNESNPIHFFNNKTIKYPSILRFPLINNYKTLQKIDKNNIEEDKQLTKECYILLKNSVAKRINNLPDMVTKNLKSTCSIAIMFSGGIDSLLLAYLVAEIIPNEVPITIDLVNLSFSEDAPDRQTGLLAYYELLK